MLLKIYILLLFICLSFCPLCWLTTRKYLFHSSRCPHCAPRACFFPTRANWLAVSFSHLYEHESTTDRAPPVLSVSRTVCLLPLTQTRRSTSAFAHRASSLSCGVFAALNCIRKRRSSDRGWSIFKSARISESANDIRVPHKANHLRVSEDASDSFPTNFWGIFEEHLRGIHY